MGFRDELAPSLQEILQNGLLDRAFQDALIPAFLFDALADVEPWGGAIGDTAIKTRAGLLPVSTVPTMYQQPTPSGYGFEQYQMTMQQWSDTIDTNMAMSAMALASKFLEDNKQLAINAAATINALARSALYAPYAGGQTWVVSGGGAGATTVVVNDASGFVNTVQDLSTTGTDPTDGLVGIAVPTVTPVSGAAPLAITANGVANTVTGVDLATNTLTLGTALGVALTAGQPVISSISSVQSRPNARATGAQIVAGDIAALATFTTGVTRLRTMKVPRRKGAYTAHIHPQTIEELQQDPNWLYAYRGRSDSPAYRNFTIGDAMGENAEFMGRFLGIDWIMDTEVPTYVNPAGVTVYQDCLVGDGALIKGPFSEMASLITEKQGGSTVQIDMIGGVARVLRAPLDRLGQVLTSSWFWIGAYAAGTDVLTGDAAVYKRACIVEHA